MKKTPREYIEEALVKRGPYSHNIIGLALSETAKEKGIAAANDLIDEFDLEDLGFSKQGVED